MARILVTGADGFVGRPLTSKLRAAGHQVMSAVRNNALEGAVAVGDIANYDGWRQLLHGVDIVVHLAARTHVTRETAAEPLFEFRRINVGGTTRLAAAAAASGVGRFLFVSSIRVNGAITVDRPFSEWDEPKPVEPYETSKWEAECAIMRIGLATGMQITRVRPSMVVGPGAKGNLRRLMRMVSLGIPLPFGAIRNGRSFVSVGNLCDLLVTCATSEKAANELFIAADSSETSTPELLRYIAAGLGKASSLFLVPVPPALLGRMGRVLGLHAQLERLMFSLRASAAHAGNILEWRPAPAIQESVMEMARAYLRNTG